MSEGGLPSVLAVLHVSQPGGGGVCRYVADTVADQVARGWNVAVAVPPGTELAHAVSKAGAEVRPWRATRSPGAHVPGETRRLEAVVRDVRPDLLHLHSSKAGLAGRLAVRGRLPTVFQPHNWSFEAVGGAVALAAVRWERLAARWADVILCVSEGERDVGLARKVRGAYVVVPNGVDLDRFAPAGQQERREARLRLGLPDGPVAVCVGRLSHAKGQDILVSAWPAVRKEVGAARLILVGDGENEAVIRAAAGEGVVFAGARPDVPDWLAAADVVVVPSRWEAMSLGMLEAMARGCSIVATDVPGAREALAGGRGALVTVGDRNALAAAVVERLRSPELRAAEGHAAAAEARRSYDLRRTLRRVATLYADCLAARAATRA